MTKRFEGKVVIVTGAAQGIGRGVARRAPAPRGRVRLVGGAEIVTDMG
ncbi:1,6-dihydroxycyclohexa-2,4-diene-1-carboxylate dehydrogenase, partial [Pseudomonas aeruginosa]